MQYRNLITLLSFVLTTGISFEARSASVEEKLGKFMNGLPHMPAHGETAEYFVSNLNELQNLTHEISLLPPEEAAANAPTFRGILTQLDFIIAQHDLNFQHPKRAEVIRLLADMILASAGSSSFENTIGQLQSPSVERRLEGLKAVAQVLKYSRGTLDSNSSPLMSQSELYDLVVAPVLNSLGTVPIEDKGKYFSFIRAVDSTLVPVSRGYVVPHEQEFGATILKDIEMLKQNAVPSAQVAEVKARVLGVLRLGRSPYGTLSGVSDVVGQLYAPMYQLYPKEVGFFLRNRGPDDLWSMTAFSSLIGRYQGDFKTAFPGLVTSTDERMFKAEANSTGNKYEFFDAAFKLGLFNISELMEIATTPDHTHSIKAKSLLDVRLSSSSPKEREVFQNDLIERLKKHPKFCEIALELLARK